MSARHSSSEQLDLASRRHYFRAIEASQPEQRFSIRFMDLGFGLDQYGGNQRAGSITPQGILRQRDGPWPGCAAIVRGLAEDGFAIVDIGKGCRPADDEPPRG